MWLACRYPFSEDQAIPDCDWEVFLRETAAMIVEQQSPQRSAIYSPTYRVLTNEKNLAVEKLG